MSISSSPLRRLGTFTFCNYWGKLFARLADRLAQCKADIRSLTTGADVRRALSKDPEILLLACRLAAHYAFAGTLVGFGVVEHDPELVALRAEYVEAMEVFIVAHEYAHCHEDERYEQVRGAQPDHVLLDLERACDLIASALTQAYGARGTRWASYSNAGAVLFFEVLDLCERAGSRSEGLSPPPPRVIRRMRPASPRSESRHYAPRRRINALP